MGVFLSEAVFQSLTITKKKPLCKINPYVPVPPKPETKRFS